MSNEYTLNNDANQVTLQKLIKLLGINVDNKLFSDEHVSLLCEKASNQLKEKEVLINIFSFMLNLVTIS